MMMETSDTKTPEDDGVGEVVQELVDDGAHWVFRIDHDDWYYLLYKLTRKYVFEKGIDDNNAAISARVDGVRYYLLRKAEVPSLAIAENFGIALPELEESRLIWLHQPDIWGDLDPPKPTVGYIGTA